MNKRHPSINPALYSETIAILDPLLTATDRAVTFDGVKTLSGEEACKYLSAMERLMAALPNGIEQMRKRIYVSERQGRASLDMKCRKRAERKQRGKGRTTKPSRSQTPRPSTESGSCSLSPVIGATEAEAQVARSKAEELMAEFGLTADDV